MRCVLLKLYVVYIGAEEQYSTYILLVDGRIPYFPTKCPIEEIYVICLLFTEVILGRLVIPDKENFNI